MKTAIKEHGLLMKGEMVRATIEDLKLQTRRVVTFENSVTVPHVMRKDWDKLRFAEARLDIQPPPLGGVGPCLYVPYEDSQVVVYSRYQTGNNIWVRETWAVGKELDDIKASELWIGDDKSMLALDYRANEKRVWHKKYQGKWRPSIYMPRWASRLDLTIMKMRVERVQDITDEDAMKEGIKNCSRCGGMRYYESGGDVQDCNCGDEYTVDEFKYLWDSINLDRGFGWEQNDLVWVIEFKRIK